MIVSFSETPLSISQRVSEKGTFVEQRVAHGCRSGHILSNENNAFYIIALEVRRASLLVKRFTISEALHY